MKTPNLALCYFYKTFIKDVKTEMDMLNKKHYLRIIQYIYSTLMYLSSNWFVFQLCTFAHNCAFTTALKM